jgi:hypothetical protein
VVAGLVQQGYEQMNARLDTIEGKIGALSSNDLVIKAHTEKREGAHRHLYSRVSADLRAARE